MTENAKKRLVILGGGPGGYPAAFLAAHEGLDVTLVDTSPNPGGVCLNVGCIPSKTLLHVAKLIEEAREATAWGIEFGKPVINLDALRAQKNHVIGRLSSGLGAMAKQHKVRFVQGRGSFEDNRTLKVEKVDGTTEEIPFDACIIATGSTPAMPALFRINSPRIMDSTGALELKDVPDTLLVVGGGYIGLEMGTVYQALGSRVTVVEMAGTLLPGADHDLSAVVTKRVQSKFEAVLLDTRVTKMEETPAGIQVTLVGLDLKDPVRTFDKVLVSVGRVPNSKNLGLDNTNVSLTERGFIKIDNARQTTEPGIYAIGDVAGDPGLAHKATHEGTTAVHAILGESSAFQPACIPAVVFTDPEVAWVGLTETEALNRNIPYKVSRMPWTASGRAVSLDRSEGLTKVLFEPQTNRVLGCGIVGVSAGDMIGEAALAIEMGAVAEDLAMTIHPHPTLGETLMEAAELQLGHSAHMAARKKNS